VFSFIPNLNQFNFSVNGNKHEDTSAKLVVRTKLANITLIADCLPNDERTVERGYNDRFIRHFAYSLIYSVAQINSSLLTITLYSSVITTLVYNDTNYSIPFITLLSGSTVLPCYYYWVSGGIKKLGTYMEVKF
jgi:hypothetical protein